MKQEELARRAGRSVQAISAIESGKAAPRAATLKAITGALGLPSAADLYLEPEEWLRRQEIEDMRRTSRIIHDVAAIAEDDFEAPSRLLSAIRKIAGPSHTS